MNSKGEKSLQEHSRSEWYVVKKIGEKLNTYPGDTEMMIGCLQRIATSTEKMVEDRARIDNELKWYKENYNKMAEENRKLRRSVSAYKGLLKRMKK